MLNTLIVAFVLAFKWISLALERGCVNKMERLNPIRVFTPPFGIPLICTFFQCLDERPQDKTVSIRKLAHSQKTKTEKFFVEVGRIGTSIRRTLKERVAVPAATPIDTVMTGMRTFRII